MNTDFIKGVVVPILTPIDADECIDEAAFRRQIDYVINGGMHGILVFGSNGEFYQIEEDEMERGLQIAVSQAADRVPVYFGIGAINTKKCVRLAKMAVKNGAAAVSILQPMFLKPTQDELFLHFKTVAEAIPETPVLLYNNPGRVGYGMTTALITRLAHEVDNIVGMKDTSGDITLTEECVRLNRDIGFKSLCRRGRRRLHRGQLYARAHRRCVRALCRGRYAGLAGGAVQAQSRAPFDGPRLLPGGGEGHGKAARP